jgi:hypothetical protein
MKIILLIICIVLISNAIRVRNLYVNYYNNFTDHKIAHFIGTFLWSVTEGICWWYLIKNIIENFE